ncbi:Bug family tripartite tricarboxylate transporter substrate binding protein [Pararhodobacter zhoushanensis]|uniref:Tripartite tricarboxylate transporter substrate binding protein n=1 Tax=Pararhodobacter zhoushanensis TaxID=2479545 RepID=A0ABT3GT79_9RHOB|nr:tripartite tricarboxylate transporter substrate binding protein [Pararhodobacter zhoushanensis]MCW1930743.1 tripartite tricarboxylate transporter substrate binding protein [Pararhodobacter zhoushanensis]
MNSFITTTRRKLLVLAGGAAMATAVTLPAFAQDAYPSRPVTFVCAFPAGSGADVLVRYFANAIQESTGHTIIVENKPGASGSISAEYVARSDPDGYTVYVHSGFSTAVNYSLWNTPAIDPRSDLMGVAGINEQPFYIVVGVDSEIQSIEQLNAYLLEAGDEATYGVSATSGRLLAAQYLSELGGTPVEVPYRTGMEMVPDVVNLGVDFAVTDPVTAMVQEREGRLRVLATGAGRRLDVAPEVPSLTEFGMDVDQMGVWAAYVPAGTPQDVVDTLAGMFHSVLETEDTQAYLRTMGGVPWIATPAEVDERMAQNVELGAYLVDLAELPKN